jgi:hypothetical protein
MAAELNKNEYNLLATRAGFNSALRHFKTAMGFSQDVSDSYNLADVLNGALDEKGIQEHQINPIVSILSEKFGYSYMSHNLQDKITDVDQLVKTINNWNNIQFIIVYYTSSGETILINPKNIHHWETAMPLDADELIVAFAGTLVGDDPKPQENALIDLLSLLYGSKATEKKGYRHLDARPQLFSEEEEEEEEEHVEPSNINDDEPIQTGRKKMTKPVAVNVTNELFHNGNVEAWKRIIQSYTSSHQGCEVHIWYEDEKINDINALFKWGKVKRGTPIMFSVAGENVTDLSKLRKYLFEGASNRFEAFLHGGPGTELDLF